MIGLSNLICFCLRLFVNFSFYQKSLYTTQLKYFVALNIFWGGHASHWSSLGNDLGLGYESEEQVPYWSCVVYDFSSTVQEDCFTPYWVPQKLPQIYPENHATFPTRIRKITVQICRNFWVTQYNTFKLRGPIQYLNHNIYQKCTAVKICREFLWH